MGKFNLIDEPWVKVVYKETGNCELVSLKKLFEDAEKIEGIAGDTKTQDFAVLRVILAVLHVVYSRFDANGNVYAVMTLNDQFIPTKIDVDANTRSGYKRALYNTWKELWDRRAFTNSVYEYLSKWQDRFYLFDKEHPFMQIRERDLESYDYKNQKGTKKTTDREGRALNLKIAESEKKIALFSPKIKQDDKSKLTEDEVARWIITCHNYIGTADKAEFIVERKNDNKSSSGWLLELGGICLEGDNLFETLMMNLILIHPEEKYIFSVQKPCWEYEPQEVLDSCLKGDICDNLAQLYTSWSRAIYISPEIDPQKGFTCQMIKLPAIEKKDQFLEPMTL